MKRSIKEHLLRFGWGYAAIALISVSGWLWAIPAKISPKAQEIIGIFLGAKSVNETLLKEESFKKADSSLLEVNLFVQSPENYYFGSFFQTQGIQSSDIFVLQKESISEDNIRAYCSSFKNEDLESLFQIGSEDLLAVKGKAYGVKLRTEEGGIWTRALSLEDEKEGDYYLFFNRRSRNFGDFYQYDGKQSYSDHGLDVLDALWEGGIKR